mgnify:CR=1 FL=1
MGQRRDVRGHKLCAIERPDQSVRHSAERQTVPLISMCGGRGLVEDRLLSPMRPDKLDSTRRDPARHEAQQIAVALRPAAQRNAEAARVR